MKFYNEVPRSELQNPIFPIPIYSETPRIDMQNISLPMKLFGESPELFEHFGVPYSGISERGSMICGGTVQEMYGEWVSYEWDWLILLKERSTLYEYALAEIDAFRKSIRAKTLGIICERLHTPRGSGKRRWVNVQDWQSNFNANIFLEIEKPVFSNKEVFSLQEKISVGIARTLKSYIWNHQIAIQYPFHYLLNGGKVAGHLMQSRRMSDRTILRIGIGINSHFAPELPRNDELVHRLYDIPTSLGLSSMEWVELYRRLKTNIQTCMNLESCHSDYLDLLHLKKGDVVQIFKDNGTIHLGSPVYKGPVYEVTEEGDIICDDGKIFGINYHVQRVNSRTS